MPPKRDRHRAYTRVPHLWRRPPQGTYYVLHWDGTAMRKVSTKTARAAEAEAFLREYLKTLDRPRGGPPVALHGAIGEWLADRTRPRNGLQQRTIGEYGRYAERFRAFFKPHLRAAEVTPAMVRHYLDQREDEGVATQTLKKELVALSMVFHFLLREGHVIGNPCAQIRLQAQSNRHPAMKDAEFAALRAALAQEVAKAEGADEKRDAQDLLDIADVLWSSGMRYVEPTRMTWEDVDLAAANWTIRSPPKKGGTRTIPIHRSLLPLLKRRRSLSAAGPFLSAPSPMTARSTDYHRISKRWREFKTRHAAFKGWSLHRMRHGFVTRLKKLGMDSAARSLARHQSIEMSEHYTHLENEDLRATLDAL